MSDSLINPIKEAQEKQKKLDKKANEVYERKLDLEYTKVHEAKIMEDAFSNFDIDEGIDGIYENWKHQNAEYIRLAKQSSVFLGLEVFKDKVAMFPRNIIYVSAETGTGKSTTVANLAFSHLKQRPGKKILIITNEEHPTDVLNRIVFLNEGWVYTDHDQITEEQIQVCEKYYDALKTRINIIDDRRNGIGGTTTTVEGVESICNSLLKKKNSGEEQYGLILIDYLQKIESSTKNDKEGWQNLRKVGMNLDNFKLQYDAPLVIFGQLKADKNDEKAYKERIEGWKGIANLATTSIEMVIDRENLRTEWRFRKNRFKGAVGTSVYTGFEKGMFVDYNDEFKQKTLIKTEKKRHKDTLSSVFNKV